MTKQTTIVVIGALRVKQSIRLPVDVCKNGWMSNSVDPDQMLHSVASDLGLHYLLGPVCPNVVKLILRLPVISNLLYSKAILCIPLKADL